MSDFDKEKERERLREKYEHDQKKRETAEKMSELLLQGATMTNAHCSECGDPIFRYDGQEFCATCEKPVDRGTDDEAADEAADGDDADSEDGAAERVDGTADDSETIEVTSPSEDAHVQFGGEADGAETGEGDAADATEGDAADATEGDADVAGSRREESADRAAGGTEPPGADEQTPRHPDRRQAGTGHGGSSRSPAPAGDDVSAARASLVRTLSRFSQRAENCEDPGRATEYLAAAREAAEALAALRR